MAVTPTMSWDDVHRLELQLRARSDAMSRKGTDPSRCPACGNEVAAGDDGIELGGLRVHHACIPTLRG